MAAPKAPLFDSAGKKAEGSDARGNGLWRRAEAARRPRDGARRDERRPQRHARCEEPRARLRRPCEAVAAKGNRPRPSGHDPGSAVDRRRRRVSADPSRLRREGEPQDAPLGAPRSSLAARSRRDASACSTARRSPSPRRGPPLRSSPRGGRSFPRVVVTSDEENVAKSFRNIDRVVVTTPGRLEVTALVWARSVLLTQDALELVEAKAANDSKAKAESS